MTKIFDPIIKRIDDTEEALNAFEFMINDLKEKDKDYILKYPTVYIHNWKDKDSYEVYIGESNDVIARTRQHYQTGKSEDSNWQGMLRENQATLYIIGNQHFNKSLTLDIENRLIHYLTSIDAVKSVHNSRGNPQKNYYPDEEFEEIFKKVWKKLRRFDKELFPSETKIMDSAIYKASPFHKLTEDQEQIKTKIIAKIMQALDKDEVHQLIFIEGEAGTGKTVLNSSTFYDLYNYAEEEKRDIQCKLIVNHDEQVAVYQQIADKLGLSQLHGEVVCKPTRFINNTDPQHPVDVVFVDEAHLLLTQGKQAYQGDNQLQDIMDRAKVTVIMFDENQVLSREQYWEAELINGYRMEAYQQQNHLRLDKQLRMQAGKEVIDWIDSFTKERRMKPIPNTSDYTIQIFDTPQDLEKAIIQKANQKETALSRMVATYDWPYNGKNKPKDQDYWCVKIGDWQRPWNRELTKSMSRKEKQKIKNLAWAEQGQTIHEVGSTFTIQGFDLNYAGVILGPSVKYRNGEIIIDPKSSYNKKAKEKRTLSNKESKSFATEFIQHEMRVLMTRGVNGLYIYACDPALRQALKENQV